MQPVPVFDKFRNDGLRAPEIDKDERLLVVGLDPVQYLEERDQPCGHPYETLHRFRPTEIDLGLQIGMERDVSEGLERHQRSARLELLVLASVLVGLGLDRRHRLGHRHEVFLLKVRDGALHPPKHHLARGVEGRAAGIALVHGASICRKSP